MLEKELFVVGRSLIYAPVGVAASPDGHAAISEENPKQLLTQSTLYLQHLSPQSERFCFLTHFHHIKMLIKFTDSQQVLAFSSYYEITPAFTDKHSMSWLEISPHPLQTLITKLSDVREILSLNSSFCFVFNQQ